MGLSAASTSGIHAASNRYTHINFHLTSDVKNKNIRVQHAYARSLVDCSTCSSSTSYINVDILFSVNDFVWQ